MYDSRRVTDRHWQCTASMATHKVLNRRYLTFIDIRTNQQLSDVKPNRPSDMSNGSLGGNEQPKLQARVLESRQPHITRRPYPYLCLVE